MRERTFIIRLALAKMARTAGARLDWTVGTGGGCTAVSIETDAVSILITDGVDAAWIDGHYYAAAYDKGGDMGDPVADLEGEDVDALQLFVGTALGLF